MSVTASNSKKENLFARLAHQQQAKAAQEDAAVAGVRRRRIPPPPLPRPGESKTRIPQEEGGAGEG